MDNNQNAPDEKVVQDKKSKGKRALKELREWVVSLVVAVLIVVVIRSTIFTIIRVDGDSMKDTLHNNERLFVTVYDAKFGTIERDEIVICHYPGRTHKLLNLISVKTNFVKRVMGIPGDTVYRKNNATYVINADTGETVALDEQYASRYPGNDYEYVLKDDEYFVVGDNRGNSHDSRNWNDSYTGDDVGPITGDMIIGHVRCVLWPLSDIRGVK